MRLTILTTICNPEQRQDKWREALECYLDIADEVVVVNGGKQIVFEDIFLLDFQVNNECDLKFVNLEWPNEEWSWEELPRHLNAGLKECTGDFVIKMDIDQFFHEKDKENIRKELKNSEFCPVASFSKFTVYSPYKAYQKGQMPIAINRSFKNIAFGLDENKYTDLCTPIQVERHKLVNGYELPVGKEVTYRYSTGIRFYNYDYFFKTVEFGISEFDRFKRAHQRFFNDKKFSGETFLRLREEYKRKVSHELKLEDHPKYIREVVREVIDKKLEVVGNL